MSRTNIDIDDDACAAVMVRYSLATKGTTTNYLHPSVPLTGDYPSNSYK